MHDKDLAGIKPDKLPPALEIGIAPAMSANPLGHVGGGEEHNNMNFEQQMLVGC